VRPIPIPTQTRVSSEKQLLSKRASSHLTTPISKSKTTVDPPEDKVSTARDWVFGSGVHTECEVSKLLSALDVLPFFDCSMDAANHHSTDIYGHDAPKGGAVNGDDLADIFAIDVESRADGLGLQSKCMRQGKDERWVTRLTFTV
jgi:hypothetical protein